MSTYKTAELEGVLLDAAVAKAGGLEFRIESLMTNPPKPIAVWTNSRTIFPCLYQPSTNWAQGGPIIEREQTVIAPFTEGHEGAPLQWCAISGVAYVGYIDDEIPPQDSRVGPTPLIAAMRAYVASKLGETAELP